MKKPEEIFKKFLTKSTVDGLFSQLDISYKHLVGCLNRGEWNSASLLLKELFLLRDFVDNHSLLGAKFEECYLQIDYRIKEVQNDISKFIKDFFKLGLIVNSEKIQELKKM